MFSKILVANRGEIAIRAFRASYELGAKTVAVFPTEDRNSIHRQKADEAYLIGEEGHPVRAYLDVDEVVRVAKEAGADAIYPGYGFLSENPNLARAAAAAGITFIGPPAEVLELARNKVAALEAARKAGVPVLKSSAPSRDIDELIAAADEVGFPIFAKAVAGGGGRGMRRVETREDLPEALQAAMREADAAFGDPTMFLEQAVLRPRHIEVQILADAEGNVMHLFERDCSIQRRHQKVIEIAPAPNLDEGIRQALYRDAVKFAKALNYVNAGTVEFLVDTIGERAGQHVFIEMNPRIQVEHTVTEESPTSTSSRRSCASPPARPSRTWACPSRPSSSRAPPCSAASPRRTRPTASGPTSARSPATVRPAAPVSGSTAAPCTQAPRSAPTLTRCWSS